MVSLDDRQRLSRQVATMSSRRASIESRTDTYPKSRDFIDLAWVDSRRGHVLKLRIV